MKRLLSNRKLWAASALALAALIVAIGLAVGMRGGVLIAFSLGSIISSGLGVGLMGLIFYSNNSGHDETVRGTSAQRQD